MIPLFQTDAERLNEGIHGTFPAELVEIVKDKSEVRHPVNEKITRPWIRHHFLTHFIRSTAVNDDVISRDANLIEIFKTTVPLSENSFIESSLSSWKMFLETSFRDADTAWYSGIRKTLHRERFHAAIEQLEAEMPASNPQRAYLFADQTRTLRRAPRVPVKLFFSLPGNERETLAKIIRQAVVENPHNLDLSLLWFAFLKAWDREEEFLDLMRMENRTDHEEWYYWVKGDLKQLGQRRREEGDHLSVFFIYERTHNNGAADYKEIADWYLKENEFKSAYHFYYKAKEFETALDLLQNISIKEFSDLTNLRRLSAGEKPFDFHADAARLTSLYQEETETLKGFTRIRAAETYKHVAAKARAQFDRETIEMKYAFGELTDDEYQRLIRQVAERSQ